MEVEKIILFEGIIVNNMQTRRRSIGLFLTVEEAYLGCIKNLSFPEDKIEIIKRMKDLEVRTEGFFGVDEP